MWIVRLALRRPYTFVVASMLLLLLTPFVLLRTATDIFPAINIPVVNIIWGYTGPSAKDIEQRFVFAHERALTTTVNNIDHIEFSPPVTVWRVGAASARSADGPRPQRVGRPRRSGKGRCLR